LTSTIICTRRRSLFITTIRFVSRLKQQAVVLFVSLAPIGLLAFRPGTCCSIIDAVCLQVIGAVVGVKEPSALLIRVVCDVLSIFVLSADPIAILLSLVIVSSCVL
jgi:hypothetical protein